VKTPEMKNPEFQIGSLGHDPRLHEAMKRSHTKSRGHAYYPKRNIYVVLRHQDLFEGVVNVS
jgi:hypothetical protein